MVAALAPDTADSDTGFPFSVQEMFDTPDPELSDAETATAIEPELFARSSASKYPFVPVAAGTLSVTVGGVRIVTVALKFPAPGYGGTLSLPPPPQAPPPASLRST